MHEFVDSKDIDAHDVPVLADWLERSWYRAGMIETVDDSAVYAALRRLRGQLDPVSHSAGTTLTLSKTRTSAPESRLVPAWTLDGRPSNTRTIVVWRWSGSGGTDDGAGWPGGTC
jgi:hypothetical protein